MSLYVSEEMGWNRRLVVMETLICIAHGSNGMASSCGMFVYSPVTSIDTGIAFSVTSVYFDTRFVV